MSPSPIVLAVSIGVAACSSANPEDSRREPLVVGATWGLSTFDDPVSPKGSSAAARFLVFDRLSEHVAHATRKHTAVRLDVHSGCTYSASELAEAFVYPGVKSVQRLSDRAFVVEFDSEEAAKKVASLASGLFDLGPYSIGAQDDDEVVLQSRSGTPFPTLEIQQIEVRDEWRLFMAGALDVLPLVAPAYSQSLERLQSATLVPMAVEHDLGLLFNLRGDVFAHKDMRQRVAQSLNIDALATMAGGSAMRRQPHVADTASRPVGTAPHRGLRLAVLRTDQGLVRVAQALRFQLAISGIQTTVVALPIDDYAQYCLDGTYDMTLLPIPRGRRGMTRFLSSDHVESTNITGYSDPAFDDAYDQRNLPLMTARLVEDVPFVSLFEQRYAAAIRSDLCLPDSTTPSPSSWRWIADLYPCNEGPP